jgi:hypothetical protein
LSPRSIGKRVSMVRKVKNVKLKPIVANAFKS